jgi:hypothetical protein
MMARTEDNRERNRQDLKKIMAKIRAETDTIRAETKAIHERRMAKLDAYQERMMAHREATETKLDPGLMQSTEKHQEIPKGEASVMLVGVPRKRRRVRNLAAECRQKRKERTRGNRGSKRKLAAACRKVSRCAKVTWRKRNLFRKIRTLEKCGRRKEFAARVRTTRCAKVARRKGRSYEGPSVEQGRWKNKTENKIARGT